MVKLFFRFKSGFVSVDKGMEGENKKGNKNRSFFLEKVIAGRVSSKSECHIGPRGNKNSVFDVHFKSENQKTLAFFYMLPMMKTVVQQPRKTTFKKFALTISPKSYVSTAIQTHIFLR